MLTSDSLSNNVSVCRQFLRSINLEADLGRKDALNGYVCQPSTKGLIENMAHQLNASQQRAFTWTGPYGTGKSSLALILASLVTPTLRPESKRILNISPNDEIDRAFISSDRGWLVLPVVGKRESVVSSISKALDKVNREVTRRPTSANVISRLLDAASNDANDGVLLIIDELGKFLESAAINGEDIHFYQDLAEAAASNSDKKLVIIGILHQAFEQYALKLGREARDEWAKVQGRYIDIPLMMATDEIIDLIGRSLEKNKLPGDLKQFEKINSIVAESIGKRRHNVPINIKAALFNCWPLHPVTAALLGPISRKKFSQNERSVFGFLSSAEPLGFKEFLDGAPNEELSIYYPWKFWDYLTANLEQSILASVDGHRWVVASDAIERTESREGCTNLHVQLAKSIALIDLFKAGSGLSSDDKILDVCVSEQNKDLIRSAIQDLARWSIIVFRKHLNSWTIYSGSDFDIESAVNQARSEIDRLNINKLIELCELNPVVAKKHYHETGTLRWLSRALINIESAEEYLSNYVPQGGAMGEFVLMTPSIENSLKQNDKAVQLLSEKTKNPLVLGLASNSERLFELGMELTALESVQKSRRELDGDPVARKELNSRIAAIKIELADELKKSFDTSKWYRYGNLANKLNASLSTIASDLADQTFSSTPKIQNELVNKDNPSSTAVKARRELMYQMIGSSHLVNLGYEGFSADAGLYYTILQACNLHQWNGGSYGFVLPSNDQDINGLNAIFQAADALFKITSEPITLEALYTTWQAAPFGLKKGVMPLLALTYFLAKEHEFCLYIENTYIPELTEAYVDEFMQDSSRVAFKYVEIGRDSENFLRNLSSTLSKNLGKHISPNPLESARGLVQLVVNLPNWTKRTNSISDSAQIFRRTILQARDPYKVLFSDLPELLDTKEEDSLLEKISELTSELQGCYPKMIDQLKDVFFQAIDFNKAEDLSKLTERAQKIKAISGNFTKDAFIGRVGDLKDDLESYESLFSILTNKRPSEWVDRDLEAAVNELGEFCGKFRKIEALSSLRGRSSTRKSFAFVYSDPNDLMVSESFDVAVEKIPLLKEASEEILNNLKLKGYSIDEIMAIFSQACQKVTVSK